MSYRSLEEHRASVLEPKLNSQCSEVPRADYSHSDTSRAEAFADAVLAIVITLMILDLRVPDVPPGRLLAGLLAQWPSYTAYITSYLSIAVQWMNHKATFLRVSQMDRGLHWCHFALLGSTALLPFPTVVIAAELKERNMRDAQVAVALYAAVGTIVCASWTLFFHYLGAHPELAVASVEDWFFRAERVRAITGVVLYTCAGALGWCVHPCVALVIFFVLPVFYGITSHGITVSPEFVRKVIVR